MVNILVLQHIKIEDPGYIKDLMLADGVNLTTIELDEGEKIPNDLTEFDGMFCMGGPMDTYMEQEYPWLIEEKEAIRYAVDELKMPFLGICLGHQILSLALNGNTFKLRFGHHGGNQPVMDISSGKVEITSQNHGFAVEQDSIGSSVEITAINLNDNTIEGIRHKEWPVFSVQYHPESSPGPQDSSYLFHKFTQLMKVGV